MNKIVRTKLGIDPKRLTPVSVDSEEGLSYLKKKILEEAQEVAEAKTTKELAEELGDLLEVIECFYSREGLDSDYIKALKTVKLQEKGDFLEFERADDNLAFSYNLYVLDKE